MKTKILAQFYAVLFILLPSIAWAQTPTPIIQGGQSWQVFATGQTAAAVYSDLIDTAGMTGITISVQDAAVACAGSIVIYGSGKATSPNLTGMTVIAHPKASVTAGGVAGNFSYEVSPLPPFIKLAATGMNDVNCTSTSIYATMVPFSTSSVVRGDTAAAQADTATYPVIVGGNRRVAPDSTGGIAVMPLRMAVNGGVAIAGSIEGTNQVLDVLVDANGNLLTVNAGGTLTLGAETLVDVAATAMPSAASARSYTFFNTGPNAIYCGFANTVTTSTGLKINSGQGATFDVAVAAPLYCITTVLQVAGSGTRTVLSTAADSVRIYGGGGGSSTSTDYTPGVPTNLALSANVSGAVTGLTAGGCYQFTCNADFQYRTGTGTPTAVATDSEGKASVMYRQCLTNSAAHTAFAFISSSAATCKVALIPAS